MPNMPKWTLRLAVMLSVMLSLTGCGYNGTYRYPCQDPANWETKECKPPVCLATQTCTVDVLPGLELEKNAKITK
jgi:hypothetical protein